MDNIELVEWSIMIMCCTLLGVGLNVLLFSNGFNYYTNPVLMIFMALSIPLIYYGLKLEFFILKKLYLKYFNKVNEMKS